jgi:3-(3-hydroxy-phenyl)propionate hydroxylase
MSEEPEVGIRRDAKGVHAMGVLEDGKHVRVVVREEHVGQTGEPTLGDLSRLLIAVRGTDYGVHSPAWIARFTDATRQAASYRERRVLLAGDAAHMHSPMGGQGLNLGVQDAVNLGWKLAQVVRGTSPDSLLDTYQAEQYPIAARVLRTTMAQTALARSDARIDALRETISELLSMDEPRKRFAAMMSGLEFITTSARDTRCSGAVCPISTWSLPTARCGYSPCCTRLDRCSSTSVNRTGSTSPRGPIGSS